MLWSSPWWCSGDTCGLDVGWNGMEWSGMEWSGIDRGWLMCKLSVVSCKKRQKGKEIFVFSF